MLECVVNISEGRDASLVRQISLAGGSSVVDVHCDGHHNRSVLTLIGEADRIEPDVRALAAATVDLLDLSTHRGVHPRMGVLDVVPWVDLDRPQAPWSEVSVLARNRFATWVAETIGVPCFLYGPERTLPDLRRSAFVSLAPDTGGPGPHPTAGAVAAGARGVLVAYNLWLATARLDDARAIARALRGPALRALGLLVGDRAQVSCNLVRPYDLGPAQAYDAVASRAVIDRAELVGLIPAAVLESIPPRRWAELDVSAEQTIEARR